MFVVAGVSGNTGREVARTLLARGKKVRVVVRDAAKAGEWREAGAEIAVARLDRADELRAALSGAEGAYLLSPPDNAAGDQLARRAEFTAALEAAVTGSGLRHVVFLSSIGAQHAEGTGVIKGLHPTEAALRRSGVPVTFVRAAYFMENVAGSLHPARTDGVLPSLFDPTKAIPMIATDDIGRVAAEALLEGPGAAGVIELEGPRRYSQDDVAAALSARLGRPVKTVRIPAPAVSQTLQSFGFGPSLADLYAEMAAGIESGHVGFEGGAARHVKGRVALEEVVAKLLG